MKTGICPKCGSAEVFMREGGVHSHGALHIAFLNLWESAPVLNAYGCAVCGYIEFMVPDHRMDTFHKILRKWTKIEPNS